MSKFLVFSDIHIHPWSAFSSVDKNGVNTRLLETVSILKQVIQKAEDESCDGILFSGDFFHTSKIEATTMDVAFRTIRRSSLPIVMIPGNHDESSKMADFHTLRSFTSRHRILLDHKEGLTTVIQGKKIAGIPYLPETKLLHDEVKKLGKKQDILLIHTGFANALEGADYISKQRDLPKAEDFKNAAGVVVAGHYHNPQFFPPGVEVAEQNTPEAARMKPGTVLIPGAPMHHSFGDSSSKKRGCWILNLGKEVMHFRPLKFPRFVKLDETEEKTLYKEADLEAIVKGNYVSATLSPERTKEDEEVIRQLLIKHSKGFVLKRQRKIKAKNRLNLSLDMERPDLLKQYLSKTADKSKRKGLYKVGMELIAKAEKELGG